MRFGLYFLFFLSGAAALGYQLTWSRMFSVSLGHEVPAVLSVICAFMSGIALGSALSNRWIARFAHPSRAFGVLEIIIACWAIVTIFLIPIVSRFAAHGIGVAPSPLRHWGITFAVPFLLLLPSTVAMGATLPAIDKIATLLAGASQVSVLYAVNTAGAVSGALLSAFVVAPAIGLRSSLLFFAVLSVVSGVGVLRFRLSEPARPTLYEKTPLTLQRIRMTVFFTGFLGIGFEVVGIRALGNVLENTVYTFALALATYLLGTAIGAVVYHKYLKRSEPRSFLGTWLCLSAVAGIISILALGKSSAFYEFLRSFLGSTKAGFLAAELVVSGAIFGLPTVCMGIVFSHLFHQWRTVKAELAEPLAWNTAGAALAPLGFGMLLLPVLGVKWALLLISAGYLLLIPKAVPALGLVGGALVLFGIINPDLRILRLPPESIVRIYKTGLMGSVAVIEDAQGQRTLRLNNRFQMGGTAAASAEYRHADIPCLLHPGPRRALVLGAGTGISMGAASYYPGLVTEGVELVPEIVSVMHHFAPENLGAGARSNLLVHIADARRFVLTSPVPYDVIVGDLFHPAQDGAGSLYTREHFAAIRERLNTNGLFCQWLPLHQMDIETLRTVTRTFIQVFPETFAFLLRFNVDAPVLGLIGFITIPTDPWSYVEGRAGEPMLREHLKKVGLSDALRLFGCVLAGPGGLSRWTGGGSINTDDNQRVLFDAPRFVYAHEKPPWDSLMPLLHLSEPLSDLSKLIPGEQRQSKLKGFIAARNVYFEGLVAQAEDDTPRAIDRFVESARITPDFTHGYSQCVTFATAYFQTDPATTRKILEALMAAQPGNPVAGQLLKRLFP